MGQEILYCYKCLTRLTSTDLDRGKGRRFGHRVACEDCLPDLLASLPPEEREEPRPPTRIRENTSRPSSSAQHPVPTSTPRAFRPAAPGKSPWPWIAAAGGGILLLVILGLAMSGGRPPAPPPPPLPKEAAAPAPPPKADPRIKEAREAYAKARTLELSKPGELDGIVAAYEEAMKRADKTELFTEVVRAYDVAVARRKEARMKAEMDADRAVQEALAREDYPGARALAEKLGGDWSARIRRHAEERARELRAKAVDARQVAELKERVTRWGYPDLAAGLADAEGWRALFDGRTTDFLLGATAANWKVENGALVPVPNPALPAKTKEEFGDVDLRFRFEFADSSNLCLWGRQGGDGALGLEWDRTRLDVLRGSAHEIVMRLRGDQAVITLDGAPAPSGARGRILKGPIQISFVGKGLRITAVDVRDPRPARLGEWQTVFDGRSTDWMSPGWTNSWKIDGGLVPFEPLPGRGRDTVQTRRRFGDGELRLVFEITGALDQLTFSVRQGAAGRAATTLAGGRLKSLGPGRHEILMSCRGRTITATVDGMAQDVYGQAFEDVGHAQIACLGDGLRIHALDWRESEP